VKRLRAKHQKQFEPLTPELLTHLKFIDECGVHLGLTRLYGRATPGVRVVESTTGYSGPHYTVVAALGLDGINAPWVFEGAMSSLAFETYVEHVLLPTVKPGDLVLLDNLSSHKREEIRAQVEQRGARLQFLPPYSPDLNPIELCWSKIKTALRSAKARTFDTLVEALCNALRAIDSADVLAWFAHCGYAVNS
jgi:transposase